MVATLAPADGATELIKPDEGFIREVMRRGGDSVKKCFQCGTCSVTCELSYAREGAAFPRKQILWAQWGLKDRILRDPAIWQCYQCNDCSANCPRGANPGDVLAAARSVAIERLSPPAFLSRMFADPRYLPLVFGIPAAILLILVAALRGFSFPEGEIEYDRFISSTAIEIAASLVVVYAVVVAGLGLLRFWRGMHLSPDEMSAAIPQTATPESGGSESAEVSQGPGAMAASASGPSLGASLASTGSDIAMHRAFRECQTDKLRLWGHLGVFYGTPFLLLAAGIAAIYTFTGAEVQRPPSDVAKIFGNLGGLLVFVGVVLFAYNRLRTKRGTWGRGSYVDWFLLGIILLLVVTGAVMEVARYAGSGPAAYSLYLVHLVLVFAAFVYAPYGKFAHVFYRVAALTFARTRAPGGRTLGLNFARRLKAAAQALVLATLVGLLAWHTIHWHMNGEQGRLFDGIGDGWWETVRGVGYNLGLMAAAGVLLGLFMERLTEVIGYRVKRIEHFAEEDAPESSPEEASSAGGRAP